MDDPVVAELCPAGHPCRIQATERRGISLAQLVTVVDHLRRRCDELGAIPGWADELSGLQVHLQTANLYHLNKNLIVPCTAAFECSLVELLSARAEDQVPEYFVSHWWGEPVVHFVMCLQHFVATRLPSRPVFWVCAYANNQHNLEADLSGDPAESSFRRAMGLCKGTLMVLDPAATPFSRVWCAFEVFVSFSEPEKIFDFAAFVPEAGVDGGAACQLPDVKDSLLHCPGRVEIITQGFVPGDHKGKGKSVKVGHVTRPNAAPIDMKADREAGFPMSIALRAIETRVQSASASVDLDRMRILNSIAGSQILDDDPPPAHPSYDAVNAAIHSRFAAAVFLNAVREHPEHAGALLRAICSDAQRTDLDLQAANSPFSDSMLEELAERLPPGLESLGLGLGGTPVGNAGAAALGGALERLPALRSLSLYVNSKTMTCSSLLALGAGIGKLANLSTLSLYFTGTRVADPGVAALARGIAALHLRSLTLGFSYTSVSADGLAPIAEAIKDKSSLRELGLTANNSNAGSQAVAAIAQCAAGLPGLLESLWLGFFKTRVDDRGARAAFEAAGELCGRGLSKVFLDFGGSAVTTPALGKAAKSPDAVRERLEALRTAGAPAPAPPAEAAAGKSTATRRSACRCCWSWQTSPESDNE